MPARSLENDELLAVRAAELYYQEDKTQDQIGSLLGITRWKVGRLLAEAKSRGIIRIEIVHPQARRLGMEHELIDAFGFDACVVVPRDDPDAIPERVARAAADYLVAMRPRTHRLGVSWGKTLHRVAQMLPEGWATSLSVVQVNGGVSHSAQPGLASATATMIAHKAGGSVTLLPTPAIVEREETKRALERDKGVAGVLEHAADSDTFLFSAGPATEVSIHVQSGYIDQGDIARLQKLGAVGDVWGRYITAEGAIADEALDRRTLGLSLDVLQRAPRSIAVVHGADKCDIALAIATNRLATVMITDEATAQYVLTAVHTRREAS
jgi:deoxyribonucleoside regulator